MARKKKYTKRTYTYRRYKQIASRNYFKVKAEYYDAIWFPDNGGKPLFANRINDEGATVASKGTNTLNQMLTGYTYSVTLAGLFSFYKITGIALEIIPKYDNGNVVTDQVDIYLGYRVGNATHMTLSEIKAVNQNLLLDPRNRQRKFFRTLGNFGDWTNTANAIDGAISIESSANGNKTTQHSWTIKVSMYLLYKFSKA